MVLGEERETFCADLIFEWSRSAFVGFNENLGGLSNSLQYKHILLCDLSNLELDRIIIVFAMVGFDALDQFAGDYFTGFLRDGITGGRTWGIRKQAIRMLIIDPLS